MTISNRIAASASIDTESTYHVGFPHTPGTLPLSSCSPVRVVGLPIRDAWASPTSPTIFDRDPAAATTRRKTYVPHAPHVTESDAKMIPLSWRRRRDRAVSQSPNGGVDSTLADLLDVAALIHIESSKWGDFRAADLYMSAWQIQIIAIAWARHAVDRHTAEMWVEAGRAYHAAMQRERIGVDVKQQT